jgi:2-dehydro-3-deoxyglucarate aldolase
MKKALKQRLASGDLTIGSWITLAHPSIAEIMAYAGFDWLVVDLEHSVITIREAEELIRIIDLCGVPPLVRVTSNDPDQIKRVMDAGAHGVIVPMICSRADAERAVSSIYYPEKGRRGVGLTRAHQFGPGFAAYTEWLPENAVVIVQIEHIDAISQLRPIFCVDGVDGYFIGPYDLSASMGMAGRFEKPDVMAAMAEIQRVGNEMKKPGGLHVVEPDIELLQTHIQNGFKFLAYSLDIRMLDTSCRAGVAGARRLQ